jgi:hypothetical protein
LPSNGGAIEPNTKISGTLATEYYVIFEKYTSISQLSRIILRKYLANVMPGSFNLPLPSERED